MTLRRRWLVAITLCPFLFAPSFADEALGVTVRVLLINEAGIKRLGRPWGPSFSESDSTVRCQRIPIIAGKPGGPFGTPEDETSEKPLDWKGPFIETYSIYRTPVVMASSLNFLQQIGDARLLLEVDCSASPTKLMLCDQVQSEAQSGEKVTVSVGQEVELRLKPADNDYVRLHLELSGQDTVAGLVRRTTHTGNFRLKLGDSQVVALRIPEEARRYAWEHCSRPIYLPEKGWAPMLLMTTYQR